MSGLKFIDDIRYVTLDRRDRGLRIERAIRRRKKKTPKPSDQRRSPHGFLIDPQYRQWNESTDVFTRNRAASLTLFKTVKNAKKFSCNNLGDEGLVLIFRPDDLEPVNITADERIAFYKAQIIKWRNRLLASGLSIHEKAVLCEEMMLSWGDLMKQHEQTLGDKESM